MILDEKKRKKNFLSSINIYISLYHDTAGACYDKSLEESFTIIFLREKGDILVFSSVVTPLKKMFCRFLIPQIADEKNYLNM